MLLFKKLFSKITDIDLIYSTTAKNRACVFVGYGLV